MLKNASREFAGSQDGRVALSRVNLRSEHVVQVLCASAMVAMCMGEQYGTYTPSSRGPQIRQLRFEKACPVLEA